MSPGWLAAVLLGCPRNLPDHLRVDGPRPAPPTPVAAAAPVTDHASALARVLGADPLARGRARALPLEGIPDTQALAAFLDARLEVETNGTLSRLVTLEADFPGTEVVALSRGYRLKLAENELSNPLVEARAAEREALALGAAVVLGPDDPSNLQALAWAGGREDFLYITERRVLAGWLAGPAVPLAPVATALQGLPFDPVRARPLGQVIVARAENRTADATAAFADLRRATHLSVVRVAADRDTEQSAWADEKRAVAAELGVTDPVRALLERAFTGFLADAGTPRSAGGALLAATALRIIDRCPDAPCTGLDRSETLHAARSWDPEIAVLADTWEIVFWDQTLATMNAGRDTGLFPSAAVDLADLLIGAAGQVDAAIVSKARPDGTVWLVAGRAMGDDGTIDWADAHVAMGRHVQRRARELAAAAPEERALLERIAARVVP